MIGGYNTTEYAIADLKWVDLVKNDYYSYWQVNISHFSMHFSGDNEELEFGDKDVFV